MNGKRELWLNDAGGRKEEKGKRRNRKLKVRQIPYYPFTPFAFSPFPFCPYKL
jgi:hypothetical protein